MASIADNIKHLLSQQNMTQHELSEKSGVAYETINKIVNGKYSPSTKLIDRIASALEVEIIDIITPQKSTINADVQGYIEYCGEIVKIKSFKHLQSIVAQIEYETKILPKEVKEIRATNEQNKKAIKRARASYTFDLNFDTIQTHDATQVDCWAFKTAKDIKNGITLDLGNQCSGYPFEMFGHTFHTSESAYLCGQFSNNTAECLEVQHKLLRETNGYTAKKYIKNAHKDLIREDWDTFRAEWMLYVIWSKCKGNASFAEKLKSIPREAVIIENSTTVHGTTNVYWGCINSEIEQARDKVAKYVELKYQNDIRFGKIKKRDVNLDETIQAARDEIQYIGKYGGGRNYMGKILKRCQLALLDGVEPQIDYDLLRSKQIYLFGELLTFSDVL